MKMLSAKAKISGFTLVEVLVMLVVLAVAHQAAAQGARFFRISGPAVTKIMEFRADGTLVWTNALAGTNYTVQTVSSLPGGTNWVDYVQLSATNGVNTNLLISFNPPAGMALIPAGSFTMGNCMEPIEGASAELPLHTVYVSAFYMDKYDVTLSLWNSVYQWATNRGYGFDNPGSGKAANHPVQTIDWYDCVKWCNARSEMAGLTPAYYTDASQTVVYRSGQVDVRNDWVRWNTGYRLPTEAEWEKAARGGPSGHRFPWGDTISWSQANYYSEPMSVEPQQGFAYDLNSTNGFDPAFDDGVEPFTSPAGCFVPNGYGLYDMAGNVFQQCWDWYGSYGSATQTDPRGPTPSQITFSSRVIRGGSWIWNTGYSRSASRYHGYSPNRSLYQLGFRSVLPPGQ